MLEYISCNVGKGEDIFKHIDDPEMLLDCEDFILRPMKRMEKDAVKLKYSALLNAKYTEAYNKPISISKKIQGKAWRFTGLYNLVVTARQFFGKEHSVLALINTLIAL